MADRKLCRISPEIGKLLVSQIAHELKNHALYLSYANYFSVEAITDIEEYYRKRAAEELKHHQWIMDYLSDADYKFTYPAVELNTEKFSDYVTPFKQTVVREIETTDLIYVIYNQAMSEKDYMTVTWLEDLLLKEQSEEEDTSRMAVTIIEEDSDIFNRAERILELLEN